MIFLFIVPRGIYKVKNLQKKKQEDSRE